MAWTNKLLIDGTGIEFLPGVFAVGVIDGFWAPAARRGDDDDIPGRDGSLGSQLPLAKYLITIPVWVGGDTVAELNSNLADLSTAVQGTDGLVQLTRHLDNGSGVDIQTAKGRFAQGLNVTMVNHTQASAEFQVYNLSGGWFNGSSYVVP